MSLLCRFAIPMNSHSRIQFNSVSGFMTTAERVLCIRITLFSGLPTPFQCFYCVRFRSDTIVYMIADPVLCLRFTLIRCFPKPLHRFCFVLFRTFAGSQTASEIILCLRISLICRFSVPLHCFRFIFFYTLAGIKTESEIILRKHIALICCFLVPLYCFAIISSDIMVINTKIALCTTMPLFRRFVQPFCRFIVIFFDTVCIVVESRKIILCFRITFLSMFSQCVKIILQHVFRQIEISFQQDIFISV